jgi:carbamoyltransferase
MLVLGLNAYHADASACLVKDGKIVAAAEEERFRRVKHWAGFPSEAVRYCIAERGVGLSDIDHVAINSKPSANLVRRLAFVLLNHPSSNLIWERLSNQARRLSITAELQKLYPKSKLRAHLHRVEHHIAHLASCFLVSPFREAVTVSVDGFGDFSSSAWGVGFEESLRVDGRVYFPHSLGILYEAITQHLGFPRYGDEYKVMGLAPYGRPTYLPAMRELVSIKGDGSFSLNLDYFRHHKKQISFEWDGGIPDVGPLCNERLNDLLGPPRLPSDPIEDRHRDLARSIQAMYEEVVFNLLNTLHERYKIDDLTLAGGCAMNSVANGKVRRMTSFKRLYVQSAAGDAGGALGAAMHVWHSIADKSSRTTEDDLSALTGDQLRGRHVMDHAYLGPRYGNEEIAALLETLSRDLKRAECKIERFDNLDEICNQTADAVAEGLVVGWFQGRMEWGPRALGNRSILCDPRRQDMKEILNQKIKRRESFRPFAPSILREHVAAWFEEDADVPFMMQVFQVREDKRRLIPAVTHVDGSGRLQTVHRNTNPRFYRLIEKFYERTGVPMMLNTSFNENEPVVCRPQEALDCFLRTNMDLAVLEDWIVQRVR